MSTRKTGSSEGLSPYAARAVAAGLSEIEARVLNAIAKLNDHATCASIGSLVWPSARGSSSCPHARPAGAVVARLQRKGYVRRASDDDRIAYQRTASARAFEVRA